LTARLIDYFSSQMISAVARLFFVADSTKTCMQLDWWSSQCSGTRLRGIRSCHVQTQPAESGNSYARKDKNWSSGMYFAFLKYH